jgi:hypothetical protein
MSDRLDRCVKCKNLAMRQMVDVIVEAPISCRSLSKKGIRSKSVIIHGVNWGGASWFCGKCGYVQKIK